MSPLIGDRFIIDCRNCARLVYANTLLSDRFYATSMNDADNNLIASAFCREFEYDDVCNKSTLDAIKMAPSIDYYLCLEWRAFFLDTLANDG